MLEDLLKKLQSIDIRKEVEFAIKESKPLLRKMNVDQLAKGEKSDRSQIGQYSEKYAQKRRRKGKQAAFVDLNFTGKLYKNIDIFVTSNETTFFSRVKYSSNMEAKYNTARGQVYGINDDNLDKARQNIQDMILTKIGKYIGAM